MNIDEQFLEMSVKSILIELVNENVRLIHAIQNSKRGSFYCPFFYDKFNRLLKILNLLPHQF